MIRPADWDSIDSAGRGDMTSSVSAPAEAVEAVDPVVAMFRGVVDILAALPDGGGHYGCEFTGRLANAGPNPDRDSLAYAFELKRVPGQHREDERLAREERYAEVRRIAARYPDLKGRKRWRAIGKETGYSEGMIRSALGER